MGARTWTSILVTLFLVPLVAAQVQYGVISGKVMIPATIDGATR